MMEQATFTYSPWGKPLEIQTKTIEEHGRKQINAISNPNEWLVALINEAESEDNYKKYLKN